MNKISFNPHRLTIRAVVMSLCLAAASGFPAFGADDGGGGGGSSDPIECREGMVYDEKQKICVWPDQLDDAALTTQGRALALAGHYDNALDALMAVRDRNDSTVLTYIGFATRKLGRVEEGIDWYHQALAIDPNNLYTREYLGEGYVAAGWTDLALDQLAEIEMICGTSCEQYEDLEAAIAGEPVHSYQ
jgi:hypothetical protein